MLGNVSTLTPAPQPTACFAIPSKTELFFVEIPPGEGRRMAKNRACGCFPRTPCFYAGPWKSVRTHVCTLGHWDDPGKDRDYKNTLVKDYAKQCDLVESGSFWRRLFLFFDIVRNR